MRFRHAPTILIGLLLPLLLAGQVSAKYVEGSTNEWWHVEGTGTFSCQGAGEVQLVGQGIITASLVVGNIYVSGTDTIFGYGYTLVGQVERNGRTWDNYAINGGMTVLNEPGEDMRVYFNGTITGTISGTGTGAIWFRGTGRALWYPSG